MKTILRIFTLGIFMTALTAVSFAQDVCKDDKEVEAKQALYKQITDNYAGPSNDKKAIAIDAGKQYVSKYGACADDKPIIDYINKSILPMEAEIAKDKKAGEKDALYKRFDNALTAVKTNGSKTADVFSSGKEILTQEPDFLDVVIVLASAGFDQTIANPPVDTYNNDTITYSKLAIDKIEAGIPSKTKDYGVKQFNYKSDLYKDTKSNALGAMNFNVGYIMYYRQGKDNAEKRKEALPYLYKSLQYNSPSKTNPEIYRTIGAWYLEEAIRLDAQRTAIVKAAGNKDTAESLDLLGMQKGYADRAIDAYARAFKIASENKASKKEYKDGLYSKLTELYKFRFDSAAGIDTFVSTIMSKPMPDPATAITPVKDAAPTTTTTPTSTTNSSMTSDTSTAVAPTKTTATTTTKTNGTNGATTTKTTVKKTTPKKKGTR